MPLRLALAALLAVTAVGCDTSEPADDGPRRVTYVVGTPGASATGVRVRYTGADGQEVRVEDPTFPFETAVEAPAAGFVSLAVDVTAGAERATLSITAEGGGEARRRNAQDEAWPFSTDSGSIVIGLSL